MSVVGVGVSGVVLSFGGNVGTKGFVGDEIGWVGGD